MRKFLFILAILTLTVFYYSCRREVSYLKNDHDQISKARNWFSDYLSQLTNPLFSNINYH
jgi:hypothetical protein